MPEGPDGSLQHGRVGQVEVEALLLQELSRGPGLLVSLLAQRAVEPAGELVLPVPGALPVSDEHQRVLAPRLAQGAAEGGGGGTHHAVS